MQIQFRKNNISCSNRILDLQLFRTVQKINNNCAQQWFGAMAAGGINSHRPSLAQLQFRRTNRYLATECKIIFITLLGLGPGRRITEYRHSRQALTVGCYIFVSLQNRVDK